MTTWDDYLADETEFENRTGDLADEISGDLRDQANELADAEMDAILAGDADAAESLAAQWKATEEAADHAEWGEQELEWSSQSAAEAEADAEDAAEAASMDLPESAAKIAGMAGIAGEASSEAVEEALNEYDQAAAALSAADEADAASTVDDGYVPYDADPGAGDDAYVPYDADPGTGDDDDTGW